MKAVVFALGARAVVVDIDGDLETLQAIVGGYIEEATRLPLPSGAVAYCNEDGHAFGLPANRGYRGTIVVVGMNYDGEQISLTDSQISTIFGAIE